jgi:hypothetical protein
MIPGKILHAAITEPGQGSRSFEIEEQAAEEDAEGTCASVDGSDLQNQVLGIPGGRFVQEGVQPVEFPLDAVERLPDLLHGGRGFLRGSA